MNSGAPLDTRRAVRPEAIAVCGPTSSGKSEIAVRVAESIGGEIVNADSRQVYYGLAVGTGAPSEELRARAAHHLFAFVDPCERYSAGAYVGDALRAIDEIVERGHTPIIVGGTGLYVEALAGTMPMDRPVADDGVRERVHREARLHAQDFLHGWLRTISPSSGARVVEGDRYRTARALEAALVTRSSSPQQPADDRGGRRVAIRTAILNVEDTLLKDRIAARVRLMYQNGLVEEAIGVWQRCAHAPALSGLGYAEALAWFRGEMTRSEAIETSIARTIRYAKRQRTWFRRMRDAIAVDAADPDAAAAAIVRLARETAKSA